MKQKVMSILSRTPLHVGAGSSVGVVDLPIIRERHTGFPVIPGSSLKGVLAALWTGDENLETDQKGNVWRVKDSDVEILFGRDNDDKTAQSGKLLIGEGKILAFPVRSAINAFAWCTCPMALARAKRDFSFAYSIPTFSDLKQCLSSQKMQIRDKVILEEYCLSYAGEIDESILTALQGLADDAAWQEELADHLIILSDDMFSYFVQNACEVAQHVKIDATTGTAVSGGLFNQENVPSETMFYSVLHQMQDGLYDKLAAQLSAQNHLLQIGADATTGLGWCSVKLIDKHA